MAKTVLIVDDNVRFVKAFKLILELNFSNYLRDIYAAYDGPSALQMMRNKKIDVVFMDYHLPGMGGVEITKEIVKNYRYIDIVAVSFREDDRSLKDMIMAGARNFITKENITKERLSYLFN